MSTELDTDPYFADEAQETFTVGSRVYLIEDIDVTKKGGEGVYFGRIGRQAAIGLDTPSGEPFKVALSFRHIRNLYR